MIEFKDLPDTTTPINAKNLNNNFKEILNKIYPINRVVIFYDNEDHSNYCGFTWERTMVGKVPVGIDSNDSDFNSIGKTGGEKTHTLTTEEMPSHNHSVLVAGGGNKYAASFTNDGGSLYYIPSENNGGNQPHNNLQPYQVVA